MKVDLFQKLDERIDDKLKDFADKNEKMVDDKIKASLPAVSTDKEEKDIEEKVKIEVKQSFDELREQVVRKNNLVIFNLKESTKDDIIEALSDDLEQLKIVLNITNPEMTNNIIKDLNSSNITRLGRKPQNKENQNKQDL